MDRRTWLLVALFALLLPLSAAPLAGEGPPGIVQGIVYSGTVGGSPLGEADVVLSGPGFQRQLSTDSDGAFRFVDVPEGEYRLQASAPGHATSHTTVTVAANETAVWHLGLTDTTLDAQDILEAFEGARAAIPVITIASFVPLAWLFATTYLKRGLMRLQPQARRSKFADERVLHTAHTWLQITMWAGIVLFALALVGLINTPFREAVITNPKWGLKVHVGYIMGLLGIWAVIITFSEVLRRVMTYLSGGLQERPRHSLSPQAALTIELFLKYLLIGLGVVVTIVVVVAAVGVLFEQSFAAQIVMGITDFLARKGNNIGFIVLFLFVSLFFWRLLGIFIEDFGAKAHRWNPKILVLAKWVFSAGFLFLVGITVLFAVMNLAGLPDEGFLLVTVIIIFLVLLTAITAGSSLRNLFSGLVLLTEKPFEEGDRVRLLEDTVCDIQEVGLMVTKARTLRGEVLAIPNNKVLEHPMLNFSSSGDYAVSLVVTVPRSIPFLKVVELLTRSALATPGIIHAITPEVYAVGLERESMVYELQAYTESAQQTRRLRSTLLYNIQQVFDEVGVPVVGSVHDAPDMAKVRHGQDPDPHDGRGPIPPPMIVPAKGVDDGASPVSAK